MATAGTLARPDGIVLAYEDTGGDGPVVVLTHGFTLTLRSWDPTVAALVAAGYRVVTWDVRGHGWTAGPDEGALYTLDAVIADLAALIDHVSDRPVVVGGLSFGGMLAMAAWADPSFRPRVRALVLADTGPGFRNAEAREAWNRTAHEQADALATRGAATFLEGDLGPTQPGAEAHLGLERHRSLRALELAMRGFLTQHDARMMDTLDTIDVPTLILVGEDDAPFLRACDVMAGKITGSRLVRIPAAGHLANLDNPAAFDDALGGFLRTLP